MTLATRTIRVGTRGSALALNQAHRVVEALTRADSRLDIKVVVISTAGDVDKQTPLAILGGQGIFAKELEAALLAESIDIAVHSAKDLTSTLPPGLVLGAVPEREDPRDVLVANGEQSLQALPRNAKVGTSSRRRVMQLRQLRPDLQPVELRGNIDTRLRKIAEGQVQAGVLAAAGIERMGWSDRITEFLPADIFVPAPGQGALGIECRADDQATRELLQQINSPDCEVAVAVERTFLREIGGGCRSPIGALATVEGGQVRLHAMLADEEMTTAHYGTRTAMVDNGQVIAVELARELQHRLSERLAVETE